MFGFGLTLHTFFVKQIKREMFHCKLRFYIQLISGVKTLASLPVDYSCFGMNNI